MNVGLLVAIVGSTMGESYLMKTWIQNLRMPYRFTCEECGLKVSSSSRDAVVKVKVLHNEHHLGARS